MIYVLAYPRTASNWLLFILEHCSGIPVANPNGIPDSTVNMVKIGTPVPNKTPLISWAHRYCDFGSRIRQDGSALVHVHRDRVEVCASFYASQRRADPDRLAAQLNENTGLPGGLVALIQWHAENSRMYEHWKGPKINVEYENLVTDPRKVLRQFEGIVPFDKLRADDFRANAEKYQEEFLAWKVAAGTQGLPVNTFGKDFSFWRNKLSDETKKAIESV